MKSILNGKAICDAHGEYEWRFIPMPKKNEATVVVWEGERYKNMPDGMDYNKFDHVWRGRAVCPKCGKTQLIEILDDTE